MGTNSPDIKLFELSSMSCSLLTGHTGFVVTLMVAPQQPNIFASASKVGNIEFISNIFTSNCDLYKCIQGLFQNKYTYIR